MFIAIEAQTVLDDEPQQYGGSSCFEAMAWLLALEGELLELRVDCACFNERREAHMLYREAAGELVWPLWEDVMGWLKEHSRLGQEVC
jgi:hypothetical protein